MDDLQRIDVLMCTFRRPEVRTAVDSVLAADVPDGYIVRLTVVDNDDTPTAQAYLADLVNLPGDKVRYIHAPGRNISIARNACLDAAESLWIAFIDDDEIATLPWLCALFDRQEQTQASGIFGVAKSVFSDDAPDWMRILQLHAPGPQRNGGVVRSGGAGNVLLRWKDTAWEKERFDIARGKTGGEDTEFFYRIGRLGATFEIAPDAIVHEPVPPARQSFKWLARRRFRVGQTYVVSAPGTAHRVLLGVKAMTKALLSFLLVIPFLGNAARWRFWFLRGVFHTGVLAGCLRIAERESYG